MKGEETMGTIVLEGNATFVWIKTKEDVESKVFHELVHYETQCSFTVCNFQLYSSFWN